MQVRKKEIWHPTQTDGLITARRLNSRTGEWEFCQYGDLKKGDVFKAYFGRRQINPLALSPDYCNIVALCLADAVRDTFYRGYGYGVEIEVGSFDEITRKVENNNGGGPPPDSMLKAAP